MWGLTLSAVGACLFLGGMVAMLALSAIASSDRVSFINLLMVLGRSQSAQEPSPSTLGAHPERWGG
jgi:hypothetical protein